MKKKKFSELRSGDKFILDIWFDNKIINCLATIRYWYTIIAPEIGQTKRKRHLTIQLSKDIFDEYIGDGFFQLTNPGNEIYLNWEIGYMDKHWNLGNTLDIVENEVEAFAEML